MKLYGFFAEFGIILGLILLFTEAKFLGGLLIVSAIMALLIKWIYDWL